MTEKKPKLRLLPHPFPTTPELNTGEIISRLNLAAARYTRPTSTTPDKFFEALEAVEPFGADDHPDEDTEEVTDDADEWPEVISVKDTERAKRDQRSLRVCVGRRTIRFVEARKKRLSGLIGGLKGSEAELFHAAVGRGEVRGLVSAHEMHEKIAKLHEGAPWLAAASTEVMAAMNRATREGKAGLTIPPLILAGPAGIGKSQWARELARLFDTPTIEVDVGATNGATFSLAGVERGWGSATPGVLVQTMLRSHVVNPVVILDEIDKIPDQIMTDKGMALPGAFEVLKSMLEPTTAKAWTCPYYRVPFNLSAVNWVMTTNSTAHLPAAFRDRCKIVELRCPTTAELLEVADRRIAQDFPDDLKGSAQPLIAGVLAQRARQHKATSLRQLGRILDEIAQVQDRQMLM